MLQKLLQKHKVSFDGNNITVGKAKGIVHCIPIVDTAPICSKRWRLPQLAKDLINSEFQSMLKALLNTRLVHSSVMFSL